MILSEPTTVTRAYYDPKRLEASAQVVRHSSGAGDVLIAEAPLPTGLQPGADLSSLGVMLADECWLPLQPLPEHHPDRY